LHTHQRLDHLRLHPFLLGPFQPLGFFHHPHPLLSRPALHLVSLRLGHGLERGFFLVGRDEFGVLFGVLGDSAFGPDEVDVI
jgi:hypothetical protein